MNFYILFPLWISICNGFLIRNPLRNIIVTKAISSSVVENLSSELFDNTIMMNQFYCFDCNHNFFMIYCAGFLWYKLYGKGQLALDDHPDRKLIVFPSYLVSRRITRQVLWMVLFLLTKNVESVY